MNIEVKQFNNMGHNLCLHCKYRNQGPNSGRCFSPKQTDEKLIKYVYWNDSCNLFEEGEQLTEQELKLLGYEKKWNELNYKHGGKGGYFYYVKIQ